MPMDKPISLKRIWAKLIVALDLVDKQKIERIVKALSPQGVKFKIGLIAFSRFGPELVKSLVRKRLDVFLDLKLYDIPNTMKETARIIAGLGCWAFTVHLEAGEDALKEVRKTIDNFSKKKPLILGVTKLTSKRASLAEVLALVKVAKKAKLDGVVASAQEVETIKQRFGKNLLVVTPGIRSRREEKKDQLRITTAQEALTKGADYLVVGRPIITKKDYLKASREVLGL